MNPRSSPRKKVQRLRDRLRQATADEILTAAEECFAAKGAQDAAMGEIARRAGLAVGTIYNHFEDKDALHAALVKRRREALLTSLDASMRVTSKQPFAEQLAQAFGVLFSFFDAHRPFMVIVREDAREKESTLRALFERFEELVRRGVKAKALRREAEDVAAAMIFGVVRGMFAMTLWREPRAVLESHAATLAELLLHGIGRRG